MIYKKFLLLLFISSFVFKLSEAQDYRCVHKCFYVNKDYKNYSVDSIINFTKPSFTEIDSFKNGLKIKNLIYNYLGKLQTSTTFYYNKQRLVIKEIINPPLLNIKDSVVYKYNSAGKLFTRTVYSSDDGVIAYIGFLEKYQYIKDTTIETIESKMFKEDTTSTVVLKYLRKDGKSVPLWLNMSEEKEELQTIVKDEKGNIVSIKNYLGITTTTNKYNTNNQLILKLQFYKNGYLQQIDTYSYK